MGCCHCSSRSFSYPVKKLGDSLSAGKFTVNTKDASLVALKLVSEVMGVSIGADVYDALVKKESGSIDARIAKIDEARANLLEALSAIDEIKNTAEAHKRELEAIRVSMTKMGIERDQLTADKDLLIQMTATEKERLRRMLGVPTRTQSLIIWCGTFIFGALTTWALTFVYDFRIKELIQGWMTAAGW